MKCSWNPAGRRYLPPQDWGSGENKLTEVRQAAHYLYCHPPVPLLNLFKICWSKQRSHLAARDPRVPQISRMVYKGPKKLTRTRGPAFLSPAQLSPGFLSPAQLSPAFQKLSTPILPTLAPTFLAAPNFLRSSLAASKPSSFCLQCVLDSSERLSRAAYSAAAAAHRHLPRPSCSAPWPLLWVVAHAEKAHQAWLRVPRRPRAVLTTVGTPKEG